MVAMLFNIFSLFCLPQTAYSMTFLICTLIGILPLTLLLTLKKKVITQEIQDEF